MSERRFDVNDAELRELFLSQEVTRALGGLGEASAPRWGRMRPQEMVEHLVWAFELSTGQAQTECPVPEEQQPRARAFLSHNRPMPQEFMNPVLRAGLPALRYAGLSEALAALARELRCFLEAPRSSGELYTHPVFGRIGYDEWHRMHYKHAYHHLLQFGLLEE